MYITSLYQAALQRPKSRQTSNRLMVGRDIMPIGKPSEKKKEDIDTVLISDDSRGASLLLAHKSVGLLHSPYAEKMKTEDSDKWFSNGDVSFRLEKEKVENEVEGISYTKDVLVVRGADGQEQRFDYAGDRDALLTKDKNGEYMLLTDQDALGAKGTLAARGNGDILFHKNAATVDNGSFSTTVFGLGGSGGTFKGGSGNTTYFGQFNQAVITGGSGANTFYGAFTETKITGGAGQNKFLGSYVGSEVTGGASGDLFEGNFLGHSLLKGLGGNDTFRGMFFDSAVEGGDGDDVIQADAALETGKSGYYMFASSVNSTFDTGSGDDIVTGVFMKSNIKTGDGKSRISGGFLASNVATGNGDDYISSFFAENSVFSTGGGNDDITIATSLQNNIEAGTGNNVVSLGGDKKGVSWQLDHVTGGKVELQNMRIARTSMSFEDIHKYEANVSRANTMGTGTQEGNVIDASLGEVELHLGSAQDMKTYDTRAMTPEKDREEAKKAAMHKEEEAQKAKVQHEKVAEEQVLRQVAQRLKEYEAAGLYANSRDRRAEKEVQGDAASQVEKARDEFEIKTLAKQDKAASTTTRLVLGDQDYRDMDGYRREVAKRNFKYQNKYLREMEKNW